MATCRLTLTLDEQAVLYVLVSIVSAAFPGILVYVVLWAVMPKAPE
jgi:phage shock protein PspC (stress-responsive transcriptional regulator)